MLSRLIASSESGFVSGSPDTSRHSSTRSSGVFGAALGTPACSSSRWRRWSASATPRAAACAARFPSLSGGRSIVTDMMVFPLNIPNFCCKKTSPFGPGGGKGVSVVGFQFPSNAFEHPLQIIHDIAVPKADHPVSVPCNFAGADSIFRRLRRVLPAIELDHELATRAGKIDNMLADRVLPPEAVWVVQLPQRPPQPLFDFGRTAPQPPRNMGSWSEPYACRAGFSPERGSRGNSPSALGGGEGRGEVGNSSAGAVTHLTLPSLRAGPLPLRPSGRR